MYADRITDSMGMAIDETNRRRAIQARYNEEHGITPTTIKKRVHDVISISKKVKEDNYELEKDFESMNKKELKEVIKKVQKDMNSAATELNFERAAKLRDHMIELKKYLNNID